MLLADETKSRGGFWLELNSSIFYDERGVATFILSLSQEGLLVLLIGLLKRSLKWEGDLQSGRYLRRQAYSACDRGWRLAGWPQIYIKECEQMAWLGGERACIDIVCPVCQALKNECLSRRQRGADCTHWSCVQLRHHSQYNYNKHFLHPNAPGIRKSHTFHKEKQQSFDWWRSLENKFMSASYLSWTLKALLSE